MKQVENSFVITGFVAKDALCYVQHKASYVVMIIML